MRFKNNWGLPVILVLLALLLAACGDSSPTAAPATVRPATTAPAATTAVATTAPATTVVVAAAPTTALATTSAAATTTVAPTTARPTTAAITSAPTTAAPTTAAPTTAVATTAAAPTTAAVLATTAAGGGDAARGLVVFKEKSCAGCHGGEQASGGLGPSLVGKGATYTLERLTTQIRQGAGVMPAYPPSQVSDDDIKSLLAFIQSLK